MDRKREGSFANSVVFYRSDAKRRHPRCDLSVSEEKDAAGGTREQVEVCAGQGRLSLIEKSD